MFPDSETNMPIHFLFVEVNTWYFFRWRSFHFWAKRHGVSVSRKRTVGISFRGRSFHFWGRRHSVSVSRKRTVGIFFRGRSFHFWGRRHSVSVSRYRLHLVFFFVGGHFTKHLVLRKYLSFVFCQFHISLLGKET